MNKTHGEKEKVREKEDKEFVLSESKLTPLPGILFFERFNDVKFVSFPISLGITEMKE